MAQLFMCFYHGFTREATIWFSYGDRADKFELPSNFDFEDVIKKTAASKLSK
jgi:hypothetical protein